MAEETPRNEQNETAQTDLDLTSLNDLALGPSWSSGPVRDNAPRLNFREERERRPRDPRAGGSSQRRDRRPPRRDNAPREEGAPRQDNADQRPQRKFYRDFSRQPAPAPFKPIVKVDLYPEDAPFKTLGTAIKNSGRTYELFEIARLILEKPERFVVVMRPLPDAQPSALFISQPDNMPFETEEAALNHVFTCNVANFFDIEEVEVDPPKGNFQMVSRCGVTGELLAPPNYHKYQQILQNHYSARCAGMPYERFLSRIESVREQEVIDQWLEKMRKQIRYKIKEPIEGAPAEFDSIENARFMLVMHAKEKLVKVVQTARFSGSIIDQMPGGAIRQSVEAVVEHQRRFPLDTANNLRGRLRRMGFSVYKKGSKGISYVCAVKRNFRKPGETFSESLQQLIEFIEAHPGFPATSLPKEYLGTEIPEGGEATLPEEDLKRLNQLRQDLRWLITSGYVTEYSTGKLYAQPVQEGAAADKNTSETEEDDAAVAPDTAAEADVPVEQTPAENADAEAQPVPTETEPAGEAAPAPAEPVAEEPQAPEQPTPEPIQEATAEPEPAPVAPVTETQQVAKAPEPDEAPKAAE